MTTKQLRYTINIMFRWLLCLLFMGVFLTAQAGEYENALKNNEKAVLYLYTTSCGYCIKFDKIYDKLNKKYGQNCKFIRIDATKPYGRVIMFEHGARYVPYVLFADGKAKKAYEVSPRCSIEYSCIEPLLENFIK